MKTLDQVEPRRPLNATNTPGDATSVYKITASGSYYLTGPLTGVSGKHGIVIAAPGVTLDLQGFTLTGVSGALTGIKVLSGNNNVVVHNGELLNWPSGGIDAVDASASSFSQLAAEGNGGDGFRLGGFNRAANCISRHSTVNGFSFNGHATIESCIADMNGNFGFIMQSGLISDSTASNNGSHGFVSRAASFMHCLSHDNTGSGYYDSDDNGRPASKGRVASARPPLPSAQAPAGIGNAGNYVGCAANSNGGYGFDLGAGPMHLRDCTADNSSGPGIHVGGGSTVSHCTVTNGSSDGIAPEDGSIVSDCTSRFNVTGIYFQGYSRIVNNHCDGNAWGLISYYIHNRIEGNSCSGNGTGIYLTGENNLVVRNTVTDTFGNAFDIVANNKVGVIVSAPNSGAIAGSTGGAGVGTTDPWANLVH